jgi:hypothetical protein
MALVFYSAPGGGSSSVLYSGASAFDLAMKAACASASSGGGAWGPGGDGRADQREELLLP